MPIEDRDFYTMQANVAHQNEKIEELKTEVGKLTEKVDILIEHMHQSKGSARTLALMSGFIGAVLAGVTEYVIYYVLQK